jgi:hypothetical protein
MTSDQVGSVPVDEGSARTERFDALIVRYPAVIAREVQVVQRVGMSAWAHDNAVQFPQPAARTPNPSQGDVLVALTAVPGARDWVDSDERTLVAAARRRGASWQEIGVALGYKPRGARQAALGRYKRLGGDPTVLDAVLSVDTAGGGDPS